MRGRIMICPFAALPMGGTVDRRSCRGEKAQEYQRMQPNSTSMGNGSQVLIAAARRLMVSFLL